MSTVARTGISRVVIQCARALMAHSRIEFVKWDAIEGQLRYFNRGDIEEFFKTRSDVPGVRVNRFAERRRYRFDDTLPAGDRGNIWLFCAELSYHPPNTTEAFSSVLAQAREYRIRTAAIFYDLIPITNPHYNQGVEQFHQRYVHALLGVDLILPISVYAAHDLARYYRDELGISDEKRREARHEIVPLPLATLNEEWTPQGRPARADERRRDLIVLLGTVEPRKQQIEVLRAFKGRRLGERYGLKAVVIGSLHHTIVEEFNFLAKDNPHIEYLGYASDHQIASIYERSRFSVFASNDEGFGLPICESIARGVPCLAADFGAMREVGEGGGCYLVDVNDQEKLAAGLELLARDDALCAKLRDEITRRVFRTWDDYARDAVRFMSNYAASSADGGRLRNSIASAIASFQAEAGDCARYQLDDTWSIVCIRSLDGAAALDRSEAAAKPLIVYIASAGLPIERLERDTAARLFEADVWLFEDEETYRRLVQLAKTQSCEAILPTLCVVGSQATSFAERAGDAVARFESDRVRRKTIAAREALLQSFYPPVFGGPTLSIVVSTYNRGPFVEENVRWILSNIGEFGGKIRLTVVDNASTDDTIKRLEQFSQDPWFELVVNAANVGMLGNLRVCATLLRARHVWVIGDDDFITPDMFGRVLKSLEQSPSLPFVFVNFGVYYRVVLGSEDSAGALIQQPIKLAPNPSPTGLYPVSAIGVEHDNLFTAIYPIVFRSDILSACFNYPFTGTPFGSLVESIPTTKIILESYASVEAFWIAEIGIVGNAHNSWQRYRVQWHGVLMPLVFELGRKVGLDPHKLYLWSKTHESLYREAKEMFPDQSVTDSFDAGDLETSFRVYRKALDEPACAGS